MTRTVLIIEDNPGIGELVSMQIADLGMQPVLENRSDTGLTRFPSPAEPRYVQTVWGVGYRFMD